MNTSKKIVITGIGPISSLGIGKEQFWSGLINQRINIREIREKFFSNEYRFQKYSIDNFKLEDFNIDSMQLKNLENWKGAKIDVDLKLMLAAVKLALLDGDLDYNPEENDIGLIVSHENPGLEEYFTKILTLSYKYLKKENNSEKEFFKNIVKSMMKNSFELQTFMPLFHIGKIFGFHGYSLYINNACASGGYAFEEARKILDNQRSSAVIIVAGDYPGLYKHLWFKSLEMISNSGYIKPFSINSDGFLMGDGATAILLETYDSAIKRGAVIYAEYCGGEFASENWKVTLPNILSGYYERVILNGLKNLNIEAQAIDIIVPHGVGTKLSDGYEYRTFKKVFGDNLKDMNLVCLKPFLGHNLGGNVLLESAALLLMIKNSTLIASLRKSTDNLLEDITMPEKTSFFEINIGLKTTNAFAGFDSALFFKKV